MTTSVIQHLLIKPDWKRSYSFKKKWKTSFQTSINNTEKRSALFTWPRKTLQFTLAISTFQEAAYLKRIIHKNTPYVWGVPIWHDASALTSSASSGQKILLVDTTYRNFEVGGDVIIFTDKDTYEIGVIASKTDSQITLVDNLAATWASGVYIYPILKCRITKSQDISWRTSHKPLISITAAETYDNVTRNTPSISSFPTYNGYPIFNTPPNWVETVEENQIFNYELLEFLGTNQLWTQWNNGEFRFKSRHDCQTKQAIQETLDFFDYHKGRLGAFWRPSWNDDIKITAAASAGDTILTVEDTDWTNYWDGDPSGEHVILIWPDNTYLVTSIKRITGTELVLNLPLNQDIAATDLNMFLVSFINLVRFNQDEIQGDFLHDSKASFQLNFQSVSGETPNKITTTTTTTTTTTSSSTTSSTSSSSTSSTSTSTSTSTTSSSTTTTEPGQTNSSTTTSTSSSTTSTSSSTTSTTEVPAAWLSDWAFRRKIAVDNTNIDSDLTHFPVAIVLGTSVGQANQDVTDIFDEVGANSKKIAITKTDGTTQIYGEIELWDNGSENAVIWVSKSDLTVTSASKTYLYIYFDSTKADNTTYIGDATDASAQNVWDSLFAAVYLLATDPSGGANSILDSTANANHGTPSGTMTSGDLVDGLIGKAIDFDGSDDYIDLGSMTGLSGTSLSFATVVNNAANPDFLRIFSIESILEVIAGSGADKYYLQTSSLTDNAVLTSTTLSVSAWEYISFSYDGSNLRSYFDGALEVTDPSTGTVGSLTNDANIAARGTSNDLNFYGKINFLFISTDARSNAWYKALKYAINDNLITFDSIESL